MLFQNTIPKFHSVGIKSIIDAYFQGIIFSFSIFFIITQYTRFRIKSFLIAGYHIICFFGFPKQLIYKINGVLNNRSSGLHEATITLQQCLFQRHVAKCKLTLRIFKYHTYYMQNIQNHLQKL